LHRFSSQVISSPFISSPFISSPFIPTTIDSTMAKTSISDQARPWVALLAKHHFWLLAVVVPLVLVPLLFLAKSHLIEEIEAVRTQIKGHISALQNVRRIPQHPNSSWANDIDASTMRVKRETYAEWRKFWESQRPLRVWPESLGPDFVKEVEALKPDGKLSRNRLERYQNNVRTLVRLLPARMAVEDSMLDPSEAGPSQQVFRPEPMRPGLGPAGTATEVSPYASIWNAENQQRIAESFSWTKAPSTAKVLLAQEELWVYGVLCDTVARINKTATGPHNAAIASVDELYVGYPAAEDNPGGTAGGRIVRTALGAAGAGMDMPMDMPPSDTEAAAVGRPPNPRFGGVQRAGPMMQPGAEEGAAVEDPDSLLRNWVYVDFSGKPMDAAQLAAAVDCQMVHRMPFVLRVVIDQRKIDALLVDLSTSMLPIDVRQIRINAGAVSQAAGPSMRSGLPDSGAMVPGSAGSGRFYDVTLELRGTVGLATPPDEAVVGLEPGQGDEAAPAEAADKPVAAPKPATVPAAAILGRPLLPPRLWTDVRPVLRRIAS
jgi:hypothetical protein